MKMKKYTVYIEQDEDGVFVGSVPNIPGCYSQGNTIDELMQNMREVITLAVRNTDIDVATGNFVGIQTMAVSV
ncbi:hypothetical protein COU78_04555 [Candidatus Peregrinibacteria bacterium CG10_big_fil_rev_8_21_14_0_10_49_24]|nr:MAG: hypothetical protein COU78_04555 [Candidatus Peregrinibacteria bacterium CG10_big_fil_rev_8_21_14_0_10_49_24]